MAKITKEQWERAKSNGLVRSTVYSRMRKGMSADEAVTLPKVEPGHRRDSNRVTYGVTVTPAQIEHAKANGISWEAVKKRIKYGYSLEKALNEPLVQRKRAELAEDMDPVKIVGRIKWLNANVYKSDPIVVPKPMLMKLKAKGISVADIRAVPV